MRHIFLQLPNNLAKKGISVANHKSAHCSAMYALFQVELTNEYGSADGKHVYALCLRLFRSLPLAANVTQHTLVLHGGLFRKVGLLFFDISRKLPSGNVGILPKMLVS